MLRKDLRLNFNRAQMFNLLTIPLFSQVFEDELL